MKTATLLGLKQNVELNKVRPVRKKNLRLNVHQKHRSDMRRKQMITDMIFYVVFLGLMTLSVGTAILHHLK